MLIVFDSLRSSASVQKKNKSEEITKKSTFLLCRSSSEKVLLPLRGPSIKTWVGKRQPSAWVSKTSNAQRILGKVANPIRFNWVSWLLTGKIKNNWPATIEVTYISRCTLAQHDGVRTTMKKGTPKILWKSISRMPMGSLDGQKNLICHRILQRKK